MGHQAEKRIRAIGPSGVTLRTHGDRTARPPGEREAPGGDGGGPISLCARRQAVYKGDLKVSECSLSSPHRPAAPVPRASSHDE